MNIDVNELRKLTKQSIDAQLKEQRRQAEIKRLKEEAERQAQITRANQIIASIPSILQEAANKGKYHADIMVVNYDDYEGSNPSRFNLKTAPAMVYDFLHQNDLNPTLEYDHDGYGRESWYNIRAHWKE